MDTIFAVIGTLFLASIVSGVVFLIALVVASLKRENVKKRAKGFGISLLCFVITSIIGIALGTVSPEEETAVAENLGFMACIAGLIAVFVIPVVYEAKKSPERKQKEAEKRAQTRERIASVNRIVEVKLLSGGSTVFRMGVVAQQLQKFAIKYADGHVVIKEVHPDTLEYKKLMKYVSWDDIK